jgi:hypothetical protein
MNRVRSANSKSEPAPNQCNALKAAVLQDKKGERSNCLKERKIISLREERKKEKMKKVW